MMKKIGIVAGLLLSLGAAAQMKEGRIVYERTAQLPAMRFSTEHGAPPPEMPKSRTDQYELLFGAGQSLYQYLPSATDDGLSFEGGGRVMRFGGTNDVVYHNFETGSRVDKREFMESEFLINDTVAKHPWKLTDESKQLLNYTVRKAIAQRIVPSFRTSMENGIVQRTEVVDTVPVVAWFTTDIPVPVGPDMQGGLPGAILELDVNKGRVLYRAVEVSPKVALAKIKAPAKGKKVTAKEYRDETVRLMEEMRKNMPGGNSIIIRQ